MPPAGAPAGAPRRRRRPAVELADIFRAHGSAYRRTHALSRAQRRAMRAIEICRTAALGGHRETCDTCGAERLAYNSCRNRHCPKCQTLAKERWLAARRQELLPVDYFHLVFTLPHELNSLAQAHPRILYDLLSTAHPRRLAVLPPIGWEARWGSRRCCTPGGAISPSTSTSTTSSQEEPFPPTGSAGGRRGAVFSFPSRPPPRASGGSAPHSFETIRPAANCPPAAEKRNQGSSGRC